MNALAWNALHVSERKSLLSLSGHSINLAHRAFDFVPKNVIDDITFAQNFAKRQKSDAPIFEKPSLYEVRAFDTSNILIKQSEALTAPDLLDYSIRHNVGLFSTPLDYATALINELNTLFGTDFALSSRVTASRVLSL